MSSTRHFPNALRLLVVVLLLTMSDAARHDNVKQLFVRIADATLDLPKVVAALSKVQYAIVRPRASGST